MWEIHKYMEIKHYTPRYTLEREIKKYFKSNENLKCSMPKMRCHKQAQVEISRSNHLQNKRSLDDDKKTRRRRETKF